MAYKIVFLSEKRGGSIYQYSEEAWNALKKIEGGLYQEDASTIYIKTTDDKRCVIEKESNPLNEFSRTGRVDINLFNMCMGKHIGLDMPFRYYKFKEANRQDEFLIASIYGGIAGDVLQFKIDKSKEYPNF